MNIAIIGGGAAGMVCAHLLDPVHRVTVFEREDVLGGHVRTLGRNVACPGLDAETTLDAGVIEFSPEHFPNFHELCGRLGVRLISVPACTGFIPRSGRPYASPGKTRLSAKGALPRAAARTRLWRLAPEFRRLRKRGTRAEEGDLEGHRLGEFLESGPASQWLRLLMLYAYSMPADGIDAMPAELALPTLRAFTGDVSWTSIEGGTYRYIERILERLRGRVVTGTEILAVHRHERGVEIQLRGSEPVRFDKVVIATPPDRVLELLSDPSPEERRRFARWRGNDVTTLVHTDCGMYQRRRIGDYSEFDVFEDPPGYYAYLNRLCGVASDRPEAFFLSLGMETEIDPARILHRQRHHTPDYDVDAFASRREIIERNGENHTFFAGAWLGDGLHEGAVVSALRVSALLGGEKI